MKNYLSSIILSVLVSLITVVLLYTYFPIYSIDETNKEATFGSAITTINGSDTLSSSRSVINNNFTSLNNGKIEVGSTTINAITTLSNLASVGTITSGTWNGNAIPVAYGGTGTTSPTSNQVIIGNGSSGFKVIGFGTSGQFLTSGGNGVAPSWSSGNLDTTQDFNFTGSAFRVKNLIASTTLTFSNSGAGYSLVFPSSQGGANQGLINNGSGTLSWTDLQKRQYTYATTSSATYTGTNTFSSQGISIPAGALTASSSIVVSANVTCVEGGFSANNCDIIISDTNGNNYIQTTLDPAVSQTAGAFLNMSVFSNNSTSAQRSSLSGFKVVNAVSSIENNSNSTSIDWTVARQFVLRVSNVSGTGNSATINSFSMIINP